MHCAQRTRLRGRQPGLAARAPRASARRVPKRYSAACTRSPLQLSRYSPLRCRLQALPMLRLQAKAIPARLGHDGRCARSAAKFYALPAVLRGEARGFGCAGFQAPNTPWQSKPLLPVRCPALPRLSTEPVAAYRLRRMLDRIRSSLTAGYNGRRATASGQGARTLSGRLNKYLTISLALTEPLVILAHGDSQTFNKGEQTMHMHTLHAVKSVHTLPDGRSVTRFTPELIPDCTAHGRLTFAHFDCWSEEPETFEVRKRAALLSARKVLAELGTAHVRWL